MNIWIVSNSSWNLYHFRKALIYEISESGISPVLLCPESKYIPNIQDNTPVSYIPIHHLEARGLNPIRDFLLFLQLFKIYYHEKPDLVIHFTSKPNIYGGIAARILRIKYINHLTGVGSGFQKPFYLSWFIKLLYRIANHSAYKVVFHNFTDLQWFLEHNLSSEQKSLVVPGSGVNPDFFKASKRQDKRELVFLFLGRIMAEKGILEFCEAAQIIKAENQNAIFRVVGSLHLSQHKSLERKFLNWISSGTIEYFPFTENTIPHFQQADFFVQPSYREGKSKALLEAMSMELPLLVSDGIGNYEMVHDNINGFIFRNHDTSDLCRVIRKALSLTSEQRQQMGNFNRIWIMNTFSEENIRKLYHTILGL